MNLNASLDAIEIEASGQIYIGENLTDCLGIKNLSRIDGYKYYIIIKSTDGNQYQELLEDNSYMIPKSIISNRGVFNVGIMAKNEATSQIAFSKTFPFRAETTICPSGETPPPYEVAMTLAEQAISTNKQAMELLDEVDQRIDEVIETAESAIDGAENVDASVAETSVGADITITDRNGTSKTVSIHNGSNKLIEETEIVIDTPVWTVQPTILNGEELNPQFVEGSYWFTTYNNADGTRLPEGQVKLTKFHNRHADAINQIFDFSNVSGAYRRNGYPIQFTNEGIRDGGASSITVSIPNGKRLVGFHAGFLGTYQYTQYFFHFDKYGKGYQRGFKENINFCSVSGASNSPASSDYTNVSMSAASFLTIVDFDIYYGKNITTIKHNQTSGKVGDNGSGSGQVTNSCFIAESAKIVKFDLSVSNSYQQILNGSVISLLWEEL